MKKSVTGWKSKRYVIKEPNAASAPGTKWNCHCLPERCDSAICVQWWLVAMHYAQGSSVYPFTMESSARM